MSKKDLVEAAVEFYLNARREEMQAGIRELLSQFTFRPRDQVARFFAGTDLIEPGLVLVEEWRPEPGTVPEGKSAMWGAVGRKR